MAGEQKFTRLGAALTDLETVWRDRLADADALLAADRHASAIAMGLYALEICLKARICRKLDQPKLPTAFEIDDIDGPLLPAGLARRLEGKSWQMSRVRKNWDGIREIANQLNDLRYLPDRRWSHPRASEFLDPLTNTRDGVLPWLSKQR